MERAGLAHDLERARRQRRIRAFQLDDQHFLGKSRQNVAQARDARVAARPFPLMAALCEPLKRQPASNARSSADVIADTLPLPFVVRSTSASWITITSPSRDSRTSSSKPSTPSACARVERSQRIFRRNLRAAAVREHERPARGARTLNPGVFSRLVEGLVDIRSEGAPAAGEDA